MEETVKQWVEHAESDLESARALMNSRRNVHALFFCQQAIEKALKAVYVFKKRELPPRIHNLTRLAELAELSADQARIRRLAHFSSFYIQSRYPDEVTKIIGQMEEGRAHPKPKYEFNKGERVKVMDGPFSNFTGIVEEVNQDKGKLRVLVSIFGRSTPVELEFFQVEKT